jgi:glutamine synthetase
MTYKKIVEMIKKNAVEFVDLRFTDTLGKDQHVAIRASLVDEDFLEMGKVFDGSSIAGWKGIEASDMVLLPDPDTAVMDPFSQRPSLILRCDVLNPGTMQPYERDPRAVAKRAEKYLKDSGVADACYMAPEPEFFIFDDVRFRTEMNSAFYHIDSIEGAWNSDKQNASGNLGHRPPVKGGYFPVPPVDSSSDLRAEMCVTLEKMGLSVELHHHEVATAGQCEIGTLFRTLLKKADEMQLLKYVVHNTAYKQGKTATFMPKPLFGDNGSGMHCHQSLTKNNQNLFAGDHYAGLSETALHYIGGILKHAKALNAFTNPSTNSYKRLVPGFEAPVYLAYGACNRSAAIRIPHTIQPKARRIEVRFPDPMANPYLAFSAMLMAGLDGIEKRIHPGEAIDQDLYDTLYSPAKSIQTVCFSLESALEHLQQDHAFLLTGNVFNTDLINAYIHLKNQEIQRLRKLPHPLEFEMYYSL